MTKRLYLFSKQDFREFPKLADNSFVLCSNAAAKLVLARQTPLSDDHPDVEYHKAFVEGLSTRKLDGLDSEALVRLNKDVLEALDTLSHVNNRRVVVDTLVVCEKVAKELKTVNPRKAAVLYERMEAFAVYGTNDLELLGKRLVYLEQAGDLLAATSPWEARRHYANALVSAKQLPRLGSVVLYERNQFGFEGRVGKVQEMEPEFDNVLERLRQKKSEMENAVTGFNEEVERRLREYAGSVADYNAARLECTDCLHANYDPPLKVDPLVRRRLKEDVAREMFGQA